MGCASACNELLGSIRATSTDPNMRVRSKTASYKYVTTGMQNLGDLLSPVGLDKIRGLSLVSVLAMLAHSVLILSVGSLACTCACYIYKCAQVRTRTRTCAHPNTCKRPLAHTNCTLRTSKFITFQDVCLPCRERPLCNR